MKAFAVLLLATCLSCASSIKVTPPDDETRRRQDREYLEKILSLGKNGDWLVMRGYHPQDEFIVLMTATPLSHAVILDRDSRTVIEALAKSVTRTRLEDFVHMSHRIILIRPMWATADRGDRALVKARGLIGKKYDFLGLVGLNNEKRFYCTELAMYVYREFMSGKERIPQVIEPGQMYLWGTVIYDTRPRN